MRSLMPRLSIALSFTACLTGFAGAETAAETRLFKECNQAYARLCKGIPPGPEMLGKCNRARPSVAEKIPDKCTQDFQSAVEGYEETRANH